MAVRVSAARYGAREEVAAAVPPVLAEETATVKVSGAKLAV